MEVRSHRARSLDIHQKRHQIIDPQIATRNTDSSFFAVFLEPICRRNQATKETDTTLPQ